MRAIAPRPVRGLAVSAILLTAMLVGPAGAAAQDSNGYVGGGVFFGPWQPDDVTGSPSLSYGNTAGDASTVIGAAVEAGVALGRNFGLGVEVGFPARRDIFQEHFYFNPFKRESRYRDTTLFGVARVRVGGPAVSAELVAGGGLVHQSSLERTALGRFGTTGYTFGPFGDELDVTRWTWGATGGLDLPVRVGSRLSLVPQLRVLVIDRGDITGALPFPTFGLPKVTYRGGLALRATF